MSLKEVSVMPGASKKSTGPIIINFHVLAHGKDMLMAFAALTEHLTGN